MLEIYARCLEEGHVFNQGQTGCFLEGELWKAIYL